PTRKGRRALDRILASLRDVEALAERDGAAGEGGHGGAAEFAGDAAADVGAREGSGERDRADAAVGAQGDRRAAAAGRTFGGLAAVGRRSGAPEGGDGGALVEGAARSGWRVELLPVGVGLVHDLGRR